MDSEILKENIEYGIPFPESPNINVNWCNTIKKIINVLLKEKFTIEKYSIFIDDIKINSNNELHFKKFSISLKKAFRKYNLFNIISKKKINIAKKKLKLSKKDQLTFADKSIGLARYLKAEYILYIEIKKEAEKDILKMKLILAKTGEVIWHYFDLI